MGMKMFDTIDTWQATCKQSVSFWASCPTPVLLLNGRCTVMLYWHWHLWLTTKKEILQERHSRQCPRTLSLAWAMCFLAQPWTTASGLGITVGAYRQHDNHRIILRRRIRVPRLPAQLVGWWQMTRSSQRRRYRTDQAHPSTPNG